MSVPEIQIHEAKKRFGRRECVFVVSDAGDPPLKPFAFSSSMLLSWLFR
jgi:hypothetical protein